MDELSKREADALGVDDLTGPQLRWRVFRLEGWLAECMLTMDDIIVGIAKGAVPGHVVQRALEVTAEIKKHYHDRKPS